MKKSTKIKRKISKVIKTGLGLTKPKEPRYSFSEEIRREVLRLQHYRCANHGCKARDWKEFDFDHIKGRSDNSITNCQALCKYHHAKKTRLDNARRVAQIRLNRRKTR